jgi:tRNA pseudouridine38-40 synthase
MPRYFIEVSYRGTNYSGFQVQENAGTIQSEIEEAFATIHRTGVTLTGSSRTDAGVHALQNYFHFDFETAIHPQFLYKANALLPPDIAITRVLEVNETAHCRFDAISREYAYHIYRFKNPFLRETAYYYPYQLNMGLMEEAAAYVKEQHNFFAFAKTNTQVNNFRCTIIKSEWRTEGEQLVYEITANRFLRGMVRLLTATLLQVGREKIPLDQFREFFHQETDKCSFSIPATGLFLKRVNYPENYFS